MLKAKHFIKKFADSGHESVHIKNKTNSIRDYFDNHHEGLGIWKWEHYFDIYQTHLSRFIGCPLNLLEVGIYSGGSLDMWTNYLGPGCNVYGVDIEPDCIAYETNKVKVLIGDQADRNFWSQFRKNTPPIDIVIDDGGHRPEQQRITLEETLPYLRKGGVYICEDVHGDDNQFTSYLFSLVNKLNHFGSINSLQKSIHSIHFYPYCIVIEKNSRSVNGFVAPKRGTQWQPFF